MNKQVLTLTNEKFQEIYSNEGFRNEVANAHGLQSKEGRLIHKQTCSYPITYIVTDEQINTAKVERERAKEETVKSIGNKLVFVGMGMTYESRYEGDICNYRIRTEFINRDGKKFFIELGMDAKRENLHVSYAIDRDLQQEYENKLNEIYEKLKGTKPHSDEAKALYDEREKWLKQPYYNYAGLERKRDLLKYTKQNILDLVNTFFNCNFQELEIDNYSLSPSDFICVSPK